MLCCQEQRVVANDYTVRWSNRLFQLAPLALPGLRGGRVVVEQRRDGTIRLRFGTSYLKFDELAPSGRTDPDLGVRCQAGRALYGVTNEPEPAGQALLEALKSADPKVRQRAADGIYRVKDRPKSWAPALTAALQDADPAVRQHVAIALATLEGPGSEAVEVLLELVRSRNPRTITDTLSFLRQLGPAAKPLLPALVELLEHPEAQTYAGQASHALGTLGTSAIEPLLRLVTADDYRVRGHAFNAFTWMGPAAVPTLRWLGTSNEHDMRIKVVWALGRLKPRTPEIAAALADVLLHETAEQIREVIIAGLWMADRRWPEAGIRRGRSVVAVPAWMLPCFPRFWIGSARSRGPRPWRSWRRSDAAGPTPGWRCLS